MKSIGAPLAVDDLRDAVERAKKYETLEDHYHSESEEIRNDQDSLETALKKQMLWQGTLEELEKIWDQSRFGALIFYPKSAVTLVSHK